MKIEQKYFTEIQDILFYVQKRKYFWANFKLDIYNFKRKKIKDQYFYTKIKNTRIVS